MHVKWKKADNALSSRYYPYALHPLVGCETVQAARWRWRLAPQYHNPMAIVHGRILCHLADAAMGVSMASSLTAGKTFSTLEIQMNYLRPIQDGGLTACVRTLCRGRTTG